MTDTPIRNVAIIAHVDHGKTTLVDQLLYQSGMFRREELDKLAGGQHNLIFDSNDLERERGITIFSKNCAILYRAADGRDLKINIIDTPGHADFGGEVERVLSMADGALLLVDAFEGPMPQTRFVLGKALEHGIRPIVFVNKVDRPDSRPEEVIGEVFDLLVELEADDETLDFPTLYGSGRDGWASQDPNERTEDLRLVFQTIREHVPAPKVRPNDPLQLLVTSLDYSDYVGRIAIGRVEAGSIRKAQDVAVLKRDGKRVNERVLEVHLFDGLGRKQVDEAGAGEVCAIVGLDDIDIGDTIADKERPVALAAPPIDEPTLHMTFRVNDGPFAGKEGEFVTSRQIKTRLDRELETDVALDVQPGETPEEFQVSGRGLMHLGILLENMRREGFELCAGKPRVIFREIDGRTCEPIERMVIECPTDFQSSVMSLIGDRRAELLEMGTRATGSYVHMEFTIPARGLIGLRSRLLTATKGQAIMHHNFHAYERVRGDIPRRKAGVMISGETGAATAYSLDALYDRGVFFIRPGDVVYEGQVVGEHCKDMDIVVNVVRNKKLSNVRASGKDDQTMVKPPRELTLEASLEYIQDDELVEITPKSIRLRKRIRGEADRRREARRTTRNV
ncbi:MAG: translational GTPase TypA [Planctomycetes bacterium]|nr:translational GTPase TypA [Planctomycetota bacterium]